MRENNNDLRVIKTRKLIKETLLQLRKSLPLEKIHVRELCKQAMINKSTFYNHYTDIYDLSRQLEKEAIHEFLEKFPERMLLIKDPEAFLTGMPIAFDENLPLLQPLFKERFDEAFYEIERQLKEEYDTGNLSEEEDIRITYILGGALHTLRTLKFEKGYSDESLAKNVSELIKNSTI